MNFDRYVAGQLDLLVINTELIMAIKNTANNPNPEWLFGGNPNAIENQEEQGQKEFTESSQLPKKSNPYDKKTAEEFYKECGIEIIGDSEGDDLFVDVKLPDGWEVRPKDHPMWSELVDDKGEVRATMFYKAAFYDRDAFVNTGS